MTISVSFEETAGDDLLYTFTVTDQDDAALDISGMTVRYAIAREAGETPVISTEGGTASASITDGANGVFQVAVNAVDTAALRSTYVYEAEVEDVAGDKSTVARGYITFRAPVIQ